MKEDLNSPNIEDVANSVGDKVNKTTNYLKSVSDYIEKKLYDKNGAVKDGGVKSLSLTFAMLVGFSMAVVVLGSVVITFIVMSKNSSIDYIQKALDDEKTRIKKVEANESYWQKKYTNVYSQCDSIGYERAKQALDFSRNLQEDFQFQKIKSKSQAIKKQEESKDWSEINNKVKTVLEEN